MSRKHTGEHLPVEKEERIVNLLSLGEPGAAIARLTHSSRNTVDAVRARRWDDVEQRKQLIRSSAARLAVKGFERLNQEMDAGKIKGALLVPVTGMATDKVIALSADPHQINVHHSIEPSRDLWNKLDDIAQALRAHLPAPTLAVDTTPLADVQPES